MKGASIQEVYGNDYTINTRDTTNPLTSPYTIPLQTQPNHPEYEMTSPLSYSFAGINDGFGFSSDYEMVPSQTISSSPSLSSINTVQQSTPRDYLLNRVLGDQECYQKLEKHFSDKFDQQFEQKFKDKMNQIKEQFSAGGNGENNKNLSDLSVVSLIKELIQRIYDFFTSNDAIKNIFMLLIALFVLLILIDLAKNILYGTPSKINHMVI